jgi:MFS family permease
MKKIKSLFDQNAAINKYFLLKFLLGLHFFNAVTLPFFMDWGGLSFAQTMILQSWFSFWLFALEVPTGAVADFLSRKLSILLGALVITLGALVYGSIPNFYMFLGGEFLFASGFALLSGASEAWLYDTLVEQGQEERVKNLIGTAHSFHLAGMLVAAPIGGWIAQIMGLNFPMLMMAGASFLAFLLGFTLKEPEVVSSKSESKRYIEVIQKGFKYLRQDGLARFIMLDAIIVGISSYYVIWSEQAVLKNVGVDLKWFGLVHALMLLTEIVISSRFRWFDRQLEKMPVNYAQLSGALTTVGFMLVFLWQNWLAAILFIILSGGFGLTREKYMSAVLHQRISSEQRATIISAMSMFKRMVIVIINPGFGWLAEQDLNWALLAAGILPIFAHLISNSYSLHLQNIQDNRLVAK